LGISPMSELTGGLDFMVRPDSFQELEEYFVSNFTVFFSGGQAGSGLTD